MLTSLAQLEHLSPRILSTRRHNGRPRPRLSRLTRRLARRPTLHRRRYSRGLGAELCGSRSGRGRVRRWRCSWRSDLLRCSLGFRFGLRSIGGRLRSLCLLNGGTRKGLLHWSTCCRWTNSRSYWWADHSGSRVPCNSLTSLRRPSLRVRHRRPGLVTRSPPGRTGRTGSRPRGLAYLELECF